MSLTSLTTGISDYATRRAIQQLASKLNYDASPTFAGLTISGEALSSALITQWSTAYSWGDHAGLYDTIGTAASDIAAHESTYDHSLLHSPVTLDALTGITLTGQQLSYTAGYAIPTTAKQAEWDSAYTHKTTEDAINGLVSCDGLGAYTAKVIGTDVQAYDADLTAIAALTPTDGNIIVGDGSTWVAESGDTARTSLGLGTGDSPTLTALVLTGTSNPLYAGPWSGCPSPIEAHTNIYSSVYCGNDGASVGRCRLGSNANCGFIQWNRYWDGSAHQIMDTTKSSWSLSFFGLYDNAVLQRSPAGSTTLTDVLAVRSTDRCLVLAGGAKCSGTVAATDVLPVNTLGTESLTNPNLTSGTSWTAANDCVLAHNRAEFTYSGGLASTLTQASGTMAIAGVAGRWYSFTYTTTYTLQLPTLTITTSFAGSAVPLPTEPGTHTVYFRAAASPGDFVISATLTPGQRVYLDTFSLKQVLGTFETGGTIRTNSKFNVSGSDGASGSFATADSKTVTVTGGIITAIT